jgi:hypothetical protein
LLTFAIEGAKKPIACFETIFSKVISDIVEILAGKNVDKDSMMFSPLVKFQKMFALVNVAEPANDIANVFSIFDKLIHRLLKEKQVQTYVHE